MCVAGRSAGWPAVGGNLSARITSSPLVAVESDGLHADQVDDAREVLASADGQSGAARRSGRACSLMSRQTRGGIGAGAVHLVDERDARHVVALHLAVDGDRLALHAADGAQHHDRPVQHAQRPLDLDGEVHVAGGVDQVDDVVVPLRPAWRRR